MGSKNDNTDEEYVKLLGNSKRASIKTGLHKETPLMSLPLESLNITTLDVFMSKYFSDVKPTDLYLDRLKHLKRLSISCITGVTIHSVPSRLEYLEIFFERINPLHKDPSIPENIQTSCQVLSSMLFVKEAKITVKTINYPLNMTLTTDLLNLTIDTPDRFSELPIVRSSTYKSLVLTANQLFYQTLYKNITYTELTRFALYLPHYRNFIDLKPFFKSTKNGTSGLIELVLEEPLDNIRGSINQLKNEIPGCSFSLKEIRMGSQKTLLTIHFVKDAVI
jgi:hypothetical protein